jgi:hypothetical protein
LQEQISKLYDHHFNFYQTEITPKQTQPNVI